MQTPTSPLQPWSPPPGRDSTEHRAGVYWDAVRVSADIAWLALEQLGHATGCVYTDEASRIWCWLVPPATVSAWPRIPGVHLCSVGTSVEVPSLNAVDGVVHWLIPPSSSRYLTDGALLQQAVAVAAERLIGVPAAALCTRCQRTTRAPVPVRWESMSSGPDRAVYACPDCALRLTPGPGRAEVLIR